MIVLALATVIAVPVQSIEVEGQAKLANGRDASLAAVWLEGSAKSKPTAKAIVDQRDRAFIPHVSVVTVGSRVEFPNNDTVLHNVFADYNAKVFDLGTYPRGAKKAVTFESKGLVVLLCNMHSEMGAFIIVVDTPYYAVADEKGRYKIKGVPPGKYKLHGWHESNQLYEQDVTVNANSKLNMSMARRRK